MASLRQLDQDDGPASAQPMNPIIPDLDNLFDVDDDAGEEYAFDSNLNDEDSEILPEPIKNTAEMAPVVVRPKKEIHSKMDSNEVTEASTDEGMEQGLIQQQTTNDEVRGMFVQADGESNIISKTEFVPDQLPFIGESLCKFCFLSDVAHFFWKENCREISQVT